MVWTNDGCVVINGSVTWTQKRGYIRSIYTWTKWDCVAVDPMNLEYDGRILITDLDLEYCMVRILSGAGSFYHITYD